LKSDGLFKSRQKRADVDNFASTDAAELSAETLQNTQSTGQGIKNDIINGDAFQIL